MKIGIVGYGYVGQAVAAAYRDHACVIYDPGFESYRDFSSLAECDCIFVCVPSPSGPDGACDTTILIDTVERLSSWAQQGQVVICKTTAPPLVYQDLQQRHAWLIHSPEFLTARNHIQDFENQAVVILGGSLEHCERAKTFLALARGSRKFLCCDIKTASLFKYMVNAFLATKVTFMNDFQDLASSIGVDWQHLIDLAQNDARLGNSHWNVPGPDGKFGWGGGCFPKDVSAIIQEADKTAISLELLKQVQNINQKHRNKHHENLCDQ